MTKKVALLIFFFSISCYSFSQKIIDSLLCTFYNQALYSYFEDPTVINEQKGIKNILIQTDFDTNCLIKEVKGLNLYYLPLGEKSGYDKHFEASKNRQSKMIYHLRPNILSIDTIDIVISTFSVHKEKDGEYSIGVSCGGTLGYIPQGRFIYDKKRAKWDFISESIIVDEKIREENSFFEKFIEDNRRRIEKEK